MADYYIASCVFTKRFPALSAAIQDYIHDRFGMETVRCCTPKYKLTEFESAMPEGILRERWKALPDTAAFSKGDNVYSLCHNCNNILEETHPEINVHSLWELVDRDDELRLPDLSGTESFVQDCWRAKDRAGEMAAVRNLVRKMGIRVLEMDPALNGSPFCGNSLYRPQPPRNPKLAPKHYAEGTSGLFIPHSEEEQEAIMRKHCEQFGNSRVICYCHYCLEGLLCGGADGVHIAQLIFGKDNEAFL